jgi:hypothetical protein
MSAAAPGPRRRVVKSSPSGPRQYEITLSCGHVYYVSAFSARYGYGTPKTLTCDRCGEGESAPRKAKS